MRFSTFIRLTMITITALSLFACGGGGGGGTTPNPLVLTADKMTGKTPVLNGGTTTITFDFGVAYAAKPVTFTALPAATLTPTSAVLDSTGKASVDVSAAPSDVTVNVTASIPGYTGTKAVSFIQQPDKVVVHVALKRAITDLAWLAFGLQNNMGADWAYSSYNLAPGYLSPINYNDASKTAFLTIPDTGFYSWAVYVFGLNVAPSVNMLELTFTSTAAGIPYFEIFTPGSLSTNLSFDKYKKSTADPLTDDIESANLAATDFVISTDYYLGLIKLASN